MKLYTTEIKALDPESGTLLTWAGPHVPGISFKDAESYCQRNGLGYCKVTGELIGEVDYKNGGPDWNTYEDYNNKNLN